MKRIAMGVTALAALLLCLWLLHRGNHLAPEQASAPSVAVRAREGHASTDIRLKKNPEPGRDHPPVSVSDTSPKTVSGVRAAESDAAEPVTEQWLAARTFGSRWGKEPQPELAAFSQWTENYLAADATARIRG